MWTTDTLWFDVALVASIFAVGNVLFGHFEAHRPRWRRLLKMAIVVGGVLVLSASVGRTWAYGFVLMLLLGAAYIHLRWLPSHGVSGWTGEPRSRYYELIGHEQTHTYLFSEADWNATGVLADAAGQSQPVNGMATITHTPDCWHLHSRMGTIEHRYRATPVTEEQAITSWTSENAVLGRLEGRFVIVNDAILSIFNSADGRYHGTEVLLQRSADAYLNRGVLFEDGEMVSTWHVDLTRARSLR